MRPRTHREEVALTATSAAALPASIEAAPAARRWAAPLWVGCLLILLTFLVIYPLLMLLFGALSDSNPVVDGFGKFNPSLEHFIEVLGNENVHLAFFNALAACGGGTILAVVIGLAFSWIVVRTNTPFKGFIAGASMIPLFVPPLVAGVAWSILGSPKTGLLNTALKWIGIDFRFDFYSMSGLIIVFGIYYAPYVYMFTASALRNMDPSLEEASEVSGASAFTTLFTVTFPLIAPAILAGIAAVLRGDAGHLRRAGGARRAGQHQRAHDLHLQAHRLEPAALQHRRRRRDPADDGDRHPGLGAAARPVGQAASPPWPARPSARAASTSARGAGSPSASPSIYLFVVVVLPTLALIIAAFRKFLFFKDFDALFDMKAYSWVHFNSIFDNPLTMLSIWNTMKVGVITAVDRRRPGLRHRLHDLPHAGRRAASRSTCCRPSPSPFPAWSSASPICGPGSACPAASTARSGSWRWPSSRASSPTR